MLSADELLVEQLFVSVVDGEPGGVVGRIVDVGEARAAEREALVGRVVVVPSLRSCGACLPCRRGHAVLCRAPLPPPTRDPQAAVSARLAVVLQAEPTELAPLAALADTGLWAYGAVVRASVEPNRAAVVVGKGPLARFVAALVAHRGARPIFAETPEVLAAALAEHGLEPFGLPVIAVSPGAAKLALELCPDGGTVVLCHAQPGAGELAALPARGLSMHGVLGAHPDLLPELVAFVNKGALDLATLWRDAASPHDDRVPVARI